MKLQAPKTRIGQFTFGFLAELVLFFIIVANMRAVAKGDYFWTAVTDTVFTAQGFMIAKLMTEYKEARSFWSGLGCTLGGTTGSLMAIWVTKHVLGG